MPVNRQTALGENLAYNRAMNVRSSGLRNGHCCERRPTILSIYRLTESTISPTFFRRAHPVKLPLYVANYGQATIGQVIHLEILIAQNVEFRPAFAEKCTYPLPGFFPPPLLYE